MLNVRNGRIAAGIVAVVASLALVACSSGNPLGGEGTEPAGGSSGPPEAGTVVIGSAAFAENEIIAQIYAQALTSNGVSVETRMSIGQRDAYLAALKDGSIDLIPEYTGNLLQYYDKDTKATSSDDVYKALASALPEGFEVLEQSEAQDKDSYNVTQQFSEKYKVTSLSDLAGLDMPLTLGGNSELAARPYGPPGLKGIYGVKDVSLTPIADNGGPLTVKALSDGTVQLADIFSTSPSITENNFVTLKDPKNMILAQNVVPLINSSKASDTVKDVLNKVSMALTTDDLLKLNGLNQGDKKEEPEQIAKDWLAEKNLF